jgi:hypothetical protein
MAKKHKLNKVTVWPHIIEAPPVRASFHRAKGRLVASNAILTPNEHLDEEAPHLNPWQDQFCEAFVFRPLSLSSTEAEYVAAVSAGQEILWLRNLFSELGYISLFVHSAY